MTWEKYLGETFNRLTLLEVQHTPPNNPTMGKFACSCGNFITLPISRVKSGNTKSCGCLRSETAVQNGRSNKTHGLSGESFYGCYIRMLDRCNNINNPRYTDYGGRGIKVCSRWENSPENFLKDMGARPSKNHTIERLDVNGDYCPDNCVWATYTEQNRNKRKYKNSSKYGAGIYKKKNRYLAFYSDKYLGSYLTVEEARHAREMYIEQEA